METVPSDPVKPLTALSNPSLEMAPIQRDSKDIAEEYKSVVGMIQDTGRNIWVIHGSFLVVAGVLAKFALEAPDRDPGTQLAASGLAGLLVVVLWLASFERNYAFYEFRINYARSLEIALGYSQFTLGKELADTGSVEIPGVGKITNEPSGTSWVLDSSPWPNRHLTFRRRLPCRHSCRLPPLGRRLTHVAA